jgi:hypothetical protein
MQAFLIVIFCLHALGLFINLAHLVYYNGPRHRPPESAGMMVFGALISAIFCIWSAKLLG